MQYILLALYLVSLFFFGFIILKLFPLVFTRVIGWVSMMLTGIIVGVPLTYYLSCLFVNIPEPIRYGVLVFISIVLLVCIRYLKTKKWRENIILEKRISYSEIFLIVIAVIFSSWMMWKSIRVGTDYTWLVSRNTVFDTAHALSLIRSFSFGNNIPFTSPFAASSVELYHFVFYFLVGLVEQFGIPLIAAFNAVSAFGFAAYLMVGFFVMYTLSGKNKLVGWLTVVFLTTHSTLTWWNFILQHGVGKSALVTLWHLPNYLFAGPYDGSAISLFFTLNVFVNQRHLAFAIVAGYLFFLLAVSLEKQKKVSGWLYGVLGCLIGLLFFWNLVVTVVVVGIVILHGIINKKYLQTAWCALGCLLVSVATSIPFFSLFKQLMVPIKTQGDIGLMTPSFFSVLSTQITYWIVNLGIGSIACIVGLMHMEKKNKRLVIVMGILFLCVVVGFAYGKNEIAQKMLNFWNVFFVGTGAYGVWYWWKKRKIFRLLSIILFVGMIASGVVDLMVIKNDFAYPAVSQEMQQRAMKLQSILPKNAIVLSYEEMFHDIAFAGRKQFFGYFAPPNEDGRLITTKEIFSSTTGEEFKIRIFNTSITHIYVPKNPLNNFSYDEIIDMCRTLYPVRYEDSEFILFEVASRMIQ